MISKPGHVSASPEGAPDKHRLPDLSESELLGDSLVISVFLQAVQVILRVDQIKELLF